MPPRWLSRRGIVAIHGRLLSEHGGSPGIRDEGLLESALARPMNHYAYTADASLSELAAVYGEALCLNHPFVDGNKRVSLVAVGVFLRLNGARLCASEVEAAWIFEELAAGRVARAELGRWIGENMEILPGS